MACNALLTDWHLRFDMATSWLTSYHSMFIQEYIPFYRAACDVGAGKEFLDLFFILWFARFPEGEFVFPGRGVTVYTAEEAELIEWHKGKRRTVSSLSSMLTYHCGNSVVTACEGYIGLAGLEIRVGIEAHS